MLQVLARRPLWLILLVGSGLIANAQTVNAQGPPRINISNPVTGTEIRADDPSKEIGKLIELLQRERARATGRLVLRAAGIEVKIAPEPRADNDLPVYPNPLFLLASVDAQGSLHLNSEKLGNLTDTSAFAKRLREIFNAREENGVFRAGSNDVEKTVSLRLASTLKVSDLDKVVSVMDIAGSEPIILLIDPPTEVTKITFPLSPSKPKKSKKP